ncbi:MAG: substrate binding domain-containing protein [Myxococcota bacterium]
MQPSQSLRGSVVVSASVTYGLLEAMPAIEQIMNQHPELEIELRLEDRFSDLLADGVDVAVRAGTSSPDSESIIARQVRAIECHLVAAPAYVRKARSPKTPDQLVDHPLLGGAGLGAGSTLRLHYNGEEYAVTLSRRLRTRTLLAVRHAAVHGLGIAVLPDFACDAMIADRTLTRILPRASLPTLAVTALYRVERRGDPAVRAVVAALQS